MCTEVIAGIGGQEAVLDAKEEGEEEHREGRGMEEGRFSHLNWNVHRAEVLRM